MLKIIAGLIIIIGAGAYFGISWEDVTNKVNDASTSAIVENAKDKATELKNETAAQLEKGKEKLEALLAKED